jgi:hypothetical protein
MKNEVAERWSPLRRHPYRNPKGILFKRSRWIAPPEGMLPSILSAEKQRNTQIIPKTGKLNKTASRDRNEIAQSNNQSIRQCNRPTLILCLIVCFDFLFFPDKIKP